MPRDPVTAPDLGSPISHLQRVTISLDDTAQEPGISFMAEVPFGFRGTEIALTVSQLRVLLEWAAD